MKEILQLFNEVLFIPIPFPITLFGNPLYYNFFGLIIVFFIIFIISLIIDRLYGGAGEWVV